MSAYALSCYYIAAGVPACAYTCDCAHKQTFWLFHASHRCCCCCCCCCCSLHVATGRSTHHWVFGRRNDSSHHVCLGHVGASIPNLQRIHTDQQQEQDRAALTVESGVCGQAEQHWQLPQVHGHQVGFSLPTSPSVCVSHVSDKGGFGGGGSCSGSSSSSIIISSRSSNSSDRQMVCHKGCAA